jgi:hypothetical protein
MVIFPMKLGLPPRQPLAPPSPLFCSHSQKPRILSPLFATLTHSASRKSFPCHSYENTRVAYPKSERRAKVSFPLPSVPTFKPSNVPTSVLISHSFLALLHSHFQQPTQNQHLTRSFKQNTGVGGYQKRISGETHANISVRAGARPLPAPTRPGVNRGGLARSSPSLQSRFTTHQSPLSSILSCDFAWGGKHQ